MTEETDNSTPVINQLRQAWLDMSNFGNHDGPCDNILTCDHCGNHLAGCSKHQSMMHRRMTVMSDAITAVIRKYGENG